MQEAVANLCRISMRDYQRRGEPLRTASKLAGLSLVPPIPVHPALMTTFTSSCNLRCGRFRHSYRAHALG